MKNYELITKLAELPAGYNVEFGTTVIKNDLDQESIFAGGSVKDIDISDTDKVITLLG